MNDQPTLSVASVKLALQSVVCPTYLWPEQPAGWQLEFIVYPDGEIVMDFLHPVSGVFWSEDSKPFEMPFKHDKTPITAQDLKVAGVPFMTTFGHAAVVQADTGPHLRNVK